MAKESSSKLVIVYTIIGFIEELFLFPVSYIGIFCSDEETTVPLRHELHLPYDIDLFNELNVERFKLSKTGKLLFRHPEGTHDDRF